MTRFWYAMAHAHCMIPSCSALDADELNAIAKWAERGDLVVLVWPVHGHGMSVYLAPAHDGVLAPDWGYIEILFRAFYDGFRAGIEVERLRVKPA